MSSVMIGTRPFIRSTASGDFAPCVELRVGDDYAVMTPFEAEEIAASLFRAATAARHEAATAEIMAQNEIPLAQISDSLEQLREKIEARRIARN